MQTPRYFLDGPPQGTHGAGGVKRKLPKGFPAAGQCPSSPGAAAPFHASSAGIRDKPLVMIFAYDDNKGLTRASGTPGHVPPTNA